MKGLILSGGKGTRLQPYTFVVPKPLMPVGDHPVLEILLRWLRKWGIRKTFVTLGHLGHLIRTLCSNGLGDGSDMETIHSRVSRKADPGRGGNHKSVCLGGRGTTSAALIDHRRFDFHSLHPLRSGSLEGQG